MLSQRSVPELGAGLAAARQARFTQEVVDKEGRLWTMWVVSSRRRALRREGDALELTGASRWGSRVASRQRARGPVLPATR